MTLSPLVNPDSLRKYRDPFPYFTARASFDQGIVASLLTWFESTASWELVETDFYEQHELRCSREEFQTPLSPFVSQEQLEVIRKKAGWVFGRPFSTRVDWSVHKLLPGQRIRIHNDLSTFGETHRVVLHLNRGWTLSQGGLLMLFNGPDALNVQRVLMPLSCSMFGFEISEKSSHAVSLVFKGERFTIVYSLYANDQITQE